MKTPKEIFDESEPQIVHYQQLKSALINFVAQNDIKPSDLRIVLHAFALAKKE